MNRIGCQAAIASKLCSYRASKENHHTAPLPFTTQGRALARLQAFDFDPPAPSGGRVEVFSWGQARSAVRRSRTHREEVVAKQTVGDAPRWTPERGNTEL